MASGIHGDGEAIEGQDIGVRYADIASFLSVPRQGIFDGASVLRPKSDSRCVPNLERGLARDLKQSLAASGGTAIPFSVFDDRPAVEPVLSEAWTYFIADTARPTITDVLTGLLGEPASERHGPSATHRDRSGNRTVFPPAAEAAGWLDRIAASEQTSADPFVLALFAYAQTVLSHPYRDGNGRLARAMYQRSLARSGLLHGPFLPLGPLVYANHRLHDGALQHLGTTGDWDPLIDVMLGLTRKAAAFTAHTLSSERTMP